MNNVNIVIREACESDLEQVLSLYAQPDLDNGAVLTPEEAARIWRGFADFPDYRLYVAQSDGAVIGTFALLIMPNLAHRGTPSGVVEDVVVSATHQGGGVGRAMMDFARQRCAEKGCYKMALSSNLKRERAHQFYESLGFEKHGYSFRIAP